MKRLLIGLTAALVCSHVHGQGTLIPPSNALSNGMPVAVMKTLDQIEPRRPIKTIPVVISDPGSYYLTCTLTSSVAGIIINCDDVRLDLGGFAVEGKSATTNIPGIAVTGPHHNISIRNGVVRGWGAHGIGAGNAHESEIIGITAFTNGGDGILLGENGLVQDCGAFKNGGRGIAADMAATIKDCKARDNGASGIEIGMAGKVTGCVSGNNNGFGIYATAYCSIQDCIVTANGGDGIVIDKNCKVHENNSGSNGSGAGILIRHTGNRVVGNNLTDNRYGVLTEVSATNNLIVRNTASGNSTANYSVEDNNAFGVRRIVLGDLDWAVGAWANFGLDKRN